MTSRRDVSRETIERLAILEYRGYDSYGLATTSEGSISVLKGVGSIGRAIGEGHFDTIAPTKLAIGHTRWATHGVVSRANAHPHLSYDKTIAIVHNGVIANYIELRQQLIDNGITFVSQTDSEVFAHLIAQHVRDGLDLLRAILRTTTEIVGEYAVGIISASDPLTLYCVRNKSPLVLCNDGQRAVLASDQLAFTGIVEGQVTFLQDGDVAMLRRDSVRVCSLGPDGSHMMVERKSIPYTASIQQVSKGNYAHYMIKEIHETPVAAATPMQMMCEKFMDILPRETERPVLLFGSGSGYYVAQIGQFLLTQLADISAIALPSDEAEAFMRLRNGDCAIAISQSGETFDTLEMCRMAIGRGAIVTSITNVVNSTLERLARHHLQQNCGPEISVLSTKSLVSQVVLLARLALEAGRERSTLPENRYACHMRALANLPEALHRCITETSEPLQDLGRKYATIRHWFFIGRGILNPTAMETALKFKEATYRHAEGVGAGFFKHGTISLIDQEFHTVALLPSVTGSAQYAATLATVSEIAARGGTVTGWGPAASDAGSLSGFSDYVAMSYQGDDITDTVLQLVTGQLFAYFYALNLGREIDQPRHLAKSVTVR